MAQEQQHASRDHCCRGEQVNKVEGRAWEKPRVGAQKFDKEASQWRPDQEEQEHISCLEPLLKTSRNPEDENKAEQVPAHFIEE